MSQHNLQSCYSVIFHKIITNILSSLINDIMTKFKNSGSLFVIEINTVLTLFLQKKRHIGNTLKMT